MHEAGHLLFGMGSRGIQARMLVMRSSGGASIVQGRFADARSAALAHYIFATQDSDGKWQTAGNRPPTAR